MLFHIITIIFSALYSDATLFGVLHILMYILSDKIERFSIYILININLQY